MAAIQPIQVEVNLPPNVITALASVQAEIGGISKTAPKRAAGEKGITYAYRGIDAIAAAAQPLLGAAGVVIVPTRTTIDNIDNITVGGNPWTDTFVTIDWTIYGPGGVDDYIEARTQGVGRDNSDKGYNKSTTMAFKNLLLRLLCIGDPKDDADSPEHQNNATDAAPEPDPQLVQARLMQATLAAMKDADKAAFKTWAAGRKFDVPALMDPTWRAAIDEWLHAEPVEQAS